MVLPGMSGAADGRQMCKYGQECYQKNPMHTEKFKHPSDKDSVKEKEKTASAGVDEQNQNPNGAKRKLPEEEEEMVEAGGEKGEPNKKAAKVDEKENEKPQDEGGDDEDEEEEEEEETTEDLLPPSPLDTKENIRQKLLVDMPEDFFAFWRFCKERNPSNPADALSPAGLLLVGAFDILSGKLKDSNNRKPSDYLCHYRSVFSNTEWELISIVFLRSSILQVLLRRTRVPDGDCKQGNGFSHRILQGRPEGNACVCCVQ